jgi:hypothetical protein
MMTILKSKNFWLAVAFSTAYWMIAPHVQKAYLFDVLNAFSIAGAIGVIVMYYPSVAKKLGTWLWIFKNNLAGVHYFIIGVMLLLLYIATRHLWNTVWRWLDKPPWMQDHLFTGFLIFCTILVCVMHFLVRDMEEGQIPRENWRWVGVFLAIGIAIASLFIIVFDPSAGFDEILVR